jgi:hypothetical protein
MKKFVLWLLAFVITLGAAYYQRKTGPTHPRTIDTVLDGKSYELKLIRSLGLDERPEIKLDIPDSSVKAKLYYRRYKSSDDYIVSEFRYKTYPVNSFLMNSVFGLTEEKGLYAKIPPQPPAGKLEYYIEIASTNDNKVLLKDTPVVIRFKGAVPGYILGPHVIIMFLAMLFSTVAGLMSIVKNPKYRKYSFWTLILLIAGGIILGPAVQKYAFGELWTGIPFGWDMTDNKTLIALAFWFLAVIVNKKKERPFYTTLAAIILLIVFSIPHSLFGSELDYESGRVIQGLVTLFLVKISKIS